jgi:cell division protein FtsL
VGNEIGPTLLAPTLERASQVLYKPLRLMGFNMHEKLTALSKRLKDEQRQLLLAAAEQNTMPSASTIQQVAMLELNIAAIENTLADER